MRTSSAALCAALLVSSAPHTALPVAATGPVREVLPFIVDDYPKALAAARAEKKPIFLETWAPW